MWSLLLLCILESKAYNIDGAKWQLAFNIHPSDGHNFGYGSDAWDNEKDLGTVKTAFGADYKNYDVTNKVANFIAIVRHQNGVCEAARVWEFKHVGKPLRDYLDVKKSSRHMATKAHYLSNYTPNDMKNKKTDPIFAVDGGLVFNWWYGGPKGNNGVRIGNSKAYSGAGLPAEDQSHWIDNYHGLGNEFGAETKNGHGSSVWWHDLGVYKINDNCSGNNCRIQGTDHGTAFKQDGTYYGQYAIYISDKAKYFPCEGVHLRVSMFDLDIVDFHRIDRSDYKGLLTYDELVFDMADSDKDSFLSLNEYKEARRENRYRKTRSKSGVLVDFHRIDRDNDGLLNFDDLAFAMADTNQDGKLSLVEYSRARADGRFTETDKI